MNTDERMFNRQFLLSNIECENLGWKFVKVAEYYLYAHPNLELTIAADDHIELFLLGYFFDYRVPERTNSDMLHSLLACRSFEDVQTATDEFSGTFVLIYKSVDTLRLFHDACGQREVFYDTTFSAFGSQPKLIEKVVTGEEWSDPQACEFYQSELFYKQRIFFADITHRSNIKRLSPNHYADLRTTSIHRFFPAKPIVKSALDDVATKAVEMLKGYLKAASLRYQLDIAVTAGYDTRVLFLASLDLPCNYYVHLNYGPDCDIDAEYGQILAKTYSKPIALKDWKIEIADSAREVHEASIDFARPRQMKYGSSDNMIIDGHLAGVYRNVFPNDEQATGAKLTHWFGFGGNPFAEAQYDIWLRKNKNLIKSLGYDYPDLLYWEGRAANWLAKRKTEAALYVESFSPFCSRAYLVLMLSAERKYRDKHLHKLYKAMIYKMSPMALKIPLNPTRSYNKARMLKRLGIYYLYIKYRGKLNLIAYLQRFKSRKK